MSLENRAVRLGLSLALAGMNYLSLVKAQVFSQEDSSGEVSLRAVSVCERPHVYFSRALDWHIDLAIVASGLMEPFGELFVKLSDLENPDEEAVYIDNIAVVPNKTCN